MTDCKNHAYKLTDCKSHADQNSAYELMNCKTCVQADGFCKDNTSKDPFSRCGICKNLGYRLS